MRGPTLALLCLLLLGSPCAAKEEAPLPAPQGIDALSPWLHHEDWTLRALAAFELRLRTEPIVVALLSRMLASELHPYAAACALSALRGRPRRELVLEGGAVLVPALLRLAALPHPVVQERALEVLRRIAPLPLGDRLDVYEGWWARGRVALELEAERLRAESQPAGTSPVGQSPSSSAAPTQLPERFYGDFERMLRHGLEVVFVIDHTGSMGPVIGAAKAQAVALLRRMRGYVPVLRTGLVSYDDGSRVRLALTHDDAELLKALNKMAAAGGGDFEEGVDKALLVALKQERVGWSQRAVRVIILIGDAPPHEGDVAPLLRSLRKAREDELFECPVIVHAVAATSQGVEHFPQIALAAGGHYVTLSRADRLAEEVVALSFGGSDPARIRPWMDEIDRLRREDPSLASPERPGR